MIQGNGRWETVGARSARKKARSLPSEKLEIRVVAEKALQPARLANFRLEISLPGLDKRHEEGILRAVRSCLIHNTLLHSPHIETVVNLQARRCAPRPGPAP